ncbi:MAG: ComF family protein [Flavobacteriales bacterium]
MHNLKYHGDQKTGVWLGELLAKHLSVLLPELEWKIVPVPIHPSKLKKRGFNQTEVIAKGMLIDKRYKIELEAITRAEKGTSLTKLDRNERSTLTESLYQLHPEEKIQGANVILLDDVLTTGATLTRCAQLLRKSKVLRLVICTLAFSEK